jgi:hypothetical protein
MGFWRWYSSITITIQKIIHGPVFYSYLKHDLWETGFCLRLQVESTQLVQILFPETADGDRIQSPKLHVLNKREDDE